MCNNPHNFVYGPGAKKKDERGIHRGRDPGDKTDMELLEKQREEYKKNKSIQTSVQRSQLKKQSEEYNESIQRDTPVFLQNFGELPATVPVHFVQHTGDTNKDKTNGKYYSK